MSAYLLVSLHTSLLHQPQPQTSTQPAAQPQAIALKFVQHLDWNQASSWKQVLNNLRLVMSAFSHIKFASTLVKSIPNSATISRVRVFNRADESQPLQLAMA